MLRLLVVLNLSHPTDGMPIIRAALGTEHVCTEKQSTLVSAKTHSCIGLLLTHICISQTVVANFVIHRTSTAHDSIIM